MESHPSDHVFYPWAGPGEEERDGTDRSGGHAAVLSTSTVGPYLYVDLQGGFEGWKTSVYLKDSLVYRGVPATDPLTGFAWGFELMGRSSVVGIRVRVPEILVDSTFSVDMQEREFLGVGVTGADGRVRRLTLVHSWIPFGYD